MSLNEFIPIWPWPHFPHMHGCAFPCCLISLLQYLIITWWIPSHLVLGFLHVVSSSWPHTLGHYNSTNVFFKSTVLFQLYVPIFTYLLIFVLPFWFVHQSWTSKISINTFWNIIRPLQERSFKFRAWPIDFIARMLHLPWIITLPLNLISYMELA